MKYRIRFGFVRGRRGDVIELTNDEARALIDSGLIVPVGDAPPPPPITGDLMVISRVNGDLPAGFPARDLLAGTKWRNVETLRAATDAELLTVKGIGPKLLQSIREACRERAE